MIMESNRRLPPPQRKVSRDVVITSTPELTNFFNSREMLESVTTLTIEEKACKDIKNGLVLAEMHSLEKLIFKSFSMKYLSYLKINNNPMLQEIIVINGVRWNDGSRWCTDGALYNVATITIESSCCIGDTECRSSQLDDLVFWRLFLLCYKPIDLVE